MRVNLASVLSGRPLLISDHGLRLVFAVVSRDEFFAAERIKAMQAREGEPLDNTNAVTVRDGVAVLPIHGPLFRFGSFFTEISGATSYDKIRTDLQTALDDTNVRAILLDINSPGGDADGCGELAEAIRAACAVKPVWAYVGGMGASAAYWLACAADRVICAPTAFLGSIGVRTAIIDTSKAEANAGVREIEIISSNAPGKRDRPVDDEIVAKAQRHVDAIEAHFVSCVAEYRGVTPEVVKEKFGGGDIVIGNDLIDGADGAVAKGMADAIGNYEDTLSALVEFASVPAGSTATARAATSHNTRMKMAKKNPMRAAEGENPDPMGKKAEGDQKEPGCEDEEYSNSADAADGDGDDDEDDKKDDAKGEGDDEPVMEDDEKDEKAAAKALASKLGLSAGASMKEILTAAAATSVPLNKVSALVEKQVEARFAKEKQMRDKQEAKDRAEKLAAAAVRGGCPTEKSAIVAFAMTNYAEAEKAFASWLKSEKQLFARTVSASEDRPAAPESVRVKQMGGVRIIKHGVDFAAEAKRIAEKDKISVEAAQSKLMQTKEGRAMYQAYLESLS